MFSLIISIIAIALVAALALASIYYGGTAFQEGSSDAEASTVVNQGQQIQAAFTLADVDELAFDDVSTTDDIDELVAADFLKEAPSVRGTAWVPDQANGYVSVEVVNEDVCDAIEERFGGTASVALGDNAFGCIADAGSSTGFTAYYNL